MIRVFAPTDKIFTSNGDAVIKPIRAVVHKVDNGDYYLELVAGLEYIDYLKPNNLVVVDTPQGAQAFRLQAPIETTRTKITIKAWHVFYDSEEYVIADSYVVNKNGSDALNHLNNATDNTSPFTVSSDIQTLNSFRCVRKSLFEAINTVAERWGGHLVRDNFNISLLGSIGTDNGVTIQYKKNLKEIVITEDWSGVCTKCLPVGKDGYTLAELYLYSPTQYSIPYTKTVSFDQAHIDKASYPTEADYLQALREDLIAQCNKYLSIAQYPTINYTLSANMDVITDVGDLVQVYDERLGVSLSATVLSFDYDAILDKYLSIEFGTASPSLSDLMSGITTEINSAISQSSQDITALLETAIEIAVSQIWQTLGSGYCIFNGEEIYLLDNIPSSSAQNVIKMDRDGLSISTTGINGTFKTFISISGTIDFSALTVSNLQLSALRGGELKIGGNGNLYGLVGLYNNGNTLIGSIGNNGLSITLTDGTYLTISPSGLLISGVNIYDRLYYKASESVTINNKIVSAYLSNGSTELSFTLELPKEIGSLTPTLSALKLDAFGVSGSLFGTPSAQGYDILTDSSLSVSYTKRDNFITYTISKSTAWSVTDNTPVTIELKTLSLNFS